MCHHSHPKLTSFAFFLLKFSSKFTQGWQTANRCSSTEKFRCKKKIRWRGILSIYLHRLLAIIFSFCCRAWTWAWSHHDNKTFERLSRSDAVLEGKPVKGKRHESIHTHPTISNKIAAYRMKTHIWDIEEMESQTEWWHAVWNVHRNILQNIFFITVAIICPVHWWNFLCNRQKYAFKFFKFYWVFLRKSVAYNFEFYWLFCTTNQEF